MKKKDLKKITNAGELAANSRTKISARGDMLDVQEKMGSDGVIETHMTVIPPKSAIPRRSHAVSWAPGQYEAIFGKGKNKK